MVNGKPVAFHINDFRSSTFQLPQQLQQAPQWNNNVDSPFIPKKKYESDLIVVLDMDECLIHSKFLSSPASARVYAHQLQQQRRHASSAADGSVESFRFALPDGEITHVFVRPGLEEFLEKVTSRFETHIFTAAVPVYADRVLDRFDPDRTRFAGRWYREHCTHDNPMAGGSGAYVKNLNRLPVTANQLDRVVLVDNNPLSFLANPSNGILVNNFYNDPSDNSLVAVYKLIEELDAHKGDVRSILGPRFALEKNLEKVARSDLNQVVEDVAAA